MKGRIIVFSGLGILVVLFVAWFLATHDRVVTRVWIGPSGEARLRPFLAAERFAERMGMKAAEVRSLPELDALPAQAVLIVPRGRQELPPPRIASLAQWVERGGHLIVEAEFLGVADPLLERLGVARSRIGDTPSKPLAVELPRAERKLTVFLPSAIKVEAAETDVRLRAGSSLVSFTRGRGLVTAAATLRFARNPSYDDHAGKMIGKAADQPAASIGAHDHAELLWAVLSLTSGREASLSPRFELRVFARPEPLSLWTFLRDNAAPALIAGGLLLALWIWSIVPRFGPLAPDAPPGRRRLLDHLRASGRYYWAKDLRSRLVVSARDAALRRIARAQPDFAGAPAAERAQRLSVLIQISKEDALRFMNAAGAMRGADFIRVTQDAQRVHSALEKGSKQK
jgi:hypothetical protein